MAERDENECREPFTPKEAVAMGRPLEAIEAPLAKERKREAALKGVANREAKKRGEKMLPKIDREHDTRDVVAKAVGMSGPTYQRAKAVVEAAEQDPISPHRSFPRMELEEQIYLHGVSVGRDWAASASDEQLTRFEDAFGPGGQLPAAEPDRGARGIVATLAVCSRDLWGDTVFFRELIGGEQVEVSENVRFVAGFVDAALAEWGERIIEAETA